MLPKLEKIKGVQPGYIIRRELQKQGMECSEFASIINEDMLTINAILHEKYRISIPLSIKFSNKFNVSPDYFKILQDSYDAKMQFNRKQKINKPDFTKIRAILFWDTDVSKIDWSMQKNAVIKRVMERGNKQEREYIILFYESLSINSLLN